MDTQTKTISVRIRDKHAPLLRQLAFEVNQVWNAANAEAAELVGARFGRLTVTEERGAVCVCLCDCGNPKTVKRSKLLAGHTKSCGCLRRNGKHLSEMSAKAVSANRKIKVGDVFGRLTIVTAYPTQAICACGATVNIQRTGPLFSGDKQSCGCLNRENAKHKAEKKARKARAESGKDTNVPMSPENKELRNKFSFLSADVKARDDYTCLLCGERGGRLHVHHILPWKTHPERRFDPSNLATLCKPCHLLEAHGGNVHNPPVQAVAEKLIGKVCSCCRAKHDRDINAAINILNVGLGCQSQ